MLFRKLSLSLIVLVGLASLSYSEWGNGLGYECKDIYIPLSQQSGWECGSDEGIGDIESLKASLRNATVETISNGVKITFADRVFFETGSAALTPAAKSDIDGVGNWVKRYPRKRVRVEGHTDSTGDPKMNKELSEKRAAEVAKSLVGHGIAESRINSVGYGETRPVASNKTEETRAANRRVEIFIFN
ncbi:MAG: OmpA family protein [Elusimicrobiota bacterium]